MKIQIDLKDPDGVYYSLKKAEVINANGLYNDKLDYEEIINIEKYVDGSEYVSIEIDTKTGKAKVLT